MTALIGASETCLSDSSWGSSCEGERQPTRPMMAKKPGIHSFLAAATVMRLATNEFPRREPATTRQMRMAVTMPKPGPTSRVMAVFWVSYSMDPVVKDLQLRHCRW